MKHPTLNREKIWGLIGFVEGAAHYLGKRHDCLMPNEMKELERIVASLEFFRADLKERIRKEGE